MGSHMKDKGREKAALWHAGILEGINGRANSYIGVQAGAILVENPCSPRRDWCCAHRARTQGAHSFSFSIHGTPYPL